MSDGPNVGYWSCACRDCFELYVGEPGDFCHDCTEASCGYHQDCSVPLECPSAEDIEADLEERILEELADDRHAE